MHFLAFDSVPLKDLITVLKDSPITSQMPINTKHHIYTVESTINQIYNRKYYFIFIPKNLENI